MALACVNSESASESVSCRHDCSARARHPIMFHDQDDRSAEMLHRGLWAPSSCFGFDANTVYRSPGDFSDRAHESICSAILGRSARITQSRLTISMPRCRKRRMASCKNLCCHGPGFLEHCWGKVVRCLPQRPNQEWRL